eukprot:SAG31_NODE_2367_length_5855_cov_2.719597_2_plen_187_part_00
MSGYDEEYGIVENTPPASARQAGGGVDNQWLSGLQKKLGMEPSRNPGAAQHEPIKEIYFTASAEFVGTLLIVFIGGFSIVSASEGMCAAPFRTTVPEQRARCAASAVPAELASAAAGRTPRCLAKRSSPCRRRNLAAWVTSGHTASCSSPSPFHPPSQSCSGALPVLSFVHRQSGAMTRDLRGHRG